MDRSTIAIVALAVLTAICLVGIFFGDLDDVTPAWLFAGIGPGAIAGILAPQPSRGDGGVLAPAPPDSRPTG